jgi:hypothetical protein
VSYHAPNASEGTRNAIENKAKTDKIIFKCIRSDRGLWQYVRFFSNFTHKYQINREISVWLTSKNGSKIKLLIWYSYIIF